MGLTVKQFKLEINFKKWCCQVCGCDRKLVDCLIKDEYYFDEESGKYELAGSTDEFETQDKAICANCRKPWTGVEPDCKTCLDTKEIDVDEQVWQNEPHTARTGSAPCPDCACPDRDDYDDQE